MSDHMPEKDPLCALWAGQVSEPFVMSPEELRKRAGAFQSRIRVRNITEYAASAFVVLAFGGVALAVPSIIVKVGAGLIILGTLYVVWQLHAMARAAGKAEVDAAQSLSRFHLGELKRQRAALATVWRWYLLPFVPGMLVFLGGVSFTPENPAPLAAKLAVFAMGAAIVGGLFAAIAWLNGRAVRALDAEIDAVTEGQGLDLP